MPENAGQAFNIPRKTSLAVHRRQLRRKCESAEYQNVMPSESAKLIRDSVELGGWDGYEGRGYKPPGPITMIRGLARFDALREGREMRQIV